MKKAVTLVLALLILTTPLLAFARASKYINSYSINISAQGNGAVKVSVNIDGTHPRMTKIGFPAISLYELNGSTWTLVHTESSKYNPNATAGSHSYSFTYQGTAGKQYYAKGSFLAEDSTGRDSKDADSPTVKAT
jgi:hypothetical protein